MPRLLLPLSLLLVWCSTAHAQTPPAAQPPAASAVVPMATPVYLIVYKAGPAWKADVPSGEQLRDHGRYVFGLHQKKVLKAGGPFTDATGGAVIVDAADLASAQAIADADPAVVQKLFVAEVHAWRQVNWDALASRLQPTPQP